MGARECSQDCGRKAAQRGLCRPCYDVRATAGALPAVEAYGQRTLPILWTLGITYRQLDHWTTRGWISADDTHPGSGKRRTWADDELAVAARMARLVRAGFTVAKAAEIAREDTTYPVPLGPGLDLTIRETRQEEAV